MKEKSYCAERERLSRQITEAVRSVYYAKADFDRASESKEDTGPLAARLADARAAESLAVAEFNAHRKEHGC